MRQAARQDACQAARQNRASDYQTALREHFARTARKIRSAKRSVFLLDLPPGPRKAIAAQGPGERGGDDLARQAVRRDGKLAVRRSHAVGWRPHLA